MATYLDRILEAHRSATEADGRDLDSLRNHAMATPPTRGFASVLRDGDGISVIAEIKRASPSKGPLAPDLDPAEVARRYEAGGASAISVLTDVEFFCGSIADLDRARAATGLPVLRKDFTVCPADVLDARLMGADAVLLIAAALDPALLRDLHQLAEEVGIDALVEVHDEEEAERALEAGAAVIGVNQRDLVTFEVDGARAERVAKVIPDSVVRVAESGVKTADDVSRLYDAGFDAVLVGETLVTSADPGAGVTLLRSKVQGPRSTG